MDKEQIIKEDQFITWFVSLIDVKLNNMNVQEILKLIKNKRDEIAFYNNDPEGKFATNVLNKLIEEIEKSQSWEK